VRIEIGDWEFLVDLVVLLGLGVDRYLNSCGNVEGSYGRTS
jgi:hypothetical protein